MNGPRPTPCPMWEKKLAALYSDDLSPTERKALKEHLASCPACEAVLADYYKMRALIRNAFIPRRPPEIWKIFLATTSKEFAHPPSLRLITSHTSLYHNLPDPAYACFVGRQRELDWLRHRLSHGYTGDPMFVTGIGGVGKSALALAVAQHYREHFEELPLEERFNAIIWISAKEERPSTEKLSTLPGSAFPTIGDLYTTIAKTLIREDITRSAGRQDLLVRKALNAQRTLLILDNINGVLDERVKTFLHSLPPCTRCLITAREAANTPHARKLTGLHLAEAETMVIAEAKVSQIRLNKIQRKLLSACTYGLPLPIKLSMARLKNGEMFEQVIHWLNSSRGNLPDYCTKEQIDLVHQQSSNAWKLLLACSLFDQNAGASRDALGAIADLPPIDLDNGLALLQKLALLNQNEHNRFWLLPFIHEHIAAEFIENDAKAIMIERWLNWLIALVENYSAHLEFHSENTHIVSFEYPHLLNAIRWCREHEYWDTLLVLTEGASFYPYLVGLFHELQENLAAGIQASEAAQDELHKGRFLRLLGRMFWAQEEYEKAQDCLDQAEKIATRYNDEIELGRSGNIRFGMLFEQDHFSAAEQVAQIMWERAERLNNLELQILAVYRLAECESQKRQFDNALRWLDKSEQLCRKLGWSRRLAWNLCLRGAILIQQEKVVAAKTFLVQSLNMATSWNEHNLIALNKQYIAQACMLAGQARLAHKWATEAYDLYERLGMMKKMTKIEHFLTSFDKKSGSYLDDP